MFKFWMWLDRHADSLVLFLVYVLVLVSVLTVCFDLRGWV